MEFTLTTPGCLDSVADFRAKYDGKVMIGCGTVMDIPDAQAAMDAGAEFLVAPVLVEEVVAEHPAARQRTAPVAATPQLEPVRARASADISTARIT